MKTRAKTHAFVFLLALSCGAQGDERLSALVRTFQQPANASAKKPSFKPLSEIRVSAVEKGDKLPSDQSSELFSSGRAYQRDWQSMPFHWRPTEFWHHPVYWDYVPWDHYGQWSHRLLQPWLEGVHFFGTFPILPYKMGLDRPFSHVYSLGYYRPGNAAPRLRHQLPWEWDAAVWESAAWVSAAFIFP